MHKQRLENMFFARRGARQVVKRIYPPSRSLHHPVVYLVDQLMDKNIYIYIWQAKEETRWFNPTTARRTDALLRRRMPERLEETVEERVKRMAAADDHRRRCVRNEKELSNHVVSRLVVGGHRFMSDVDRRRYGPKARQAGDRNCARDRVCR